MEKKLYSLKIDYGGGIVDDLSYMQTSAKTIEHIQYAVKYTAEHFEAYGYFVTFNFKMEDKNEREHEGSDILGLLLDL